jgi:hypothetical protein
MRIGIDLRPLQTQQSRNRGIGNYVRHQVAALLEVVQEDELLLFYAPHVEPPTLFKTALAGSHCRTVPLETPSEIPITIGQPVNPNDAFRQWSTLQGILSHYDLDVFHVTSPFEWEIAVGSSFHTSRLVVTLYDLIPLVFAPVYLSPAPPEMREMYFQRLKLLARADRLLAISDASRRDAIDLLALPGDRIDVVHAGAGERFKPLSDRTLIQATKARFGLTGGLSQSDGYILSVLG